MVLSLFGEEAPALSAKRDAIANVHMDALVIEPKNEYIKSLEETMTR